MLQVHTRWAALSGACQLRDTKTVSSMTKEPLLRHWGNMWLTSRDDPPELAARSWYKRGMDERSHTVAVYEIFSPNSDVPHVAGVASPYPIDTACFLAELADEISDSSKGKIESVQIDLSMESIANRLKFDVLSVRTEKKSSSIVKQFNDPRSPWDVERGDYFAVGIFVEHAGRTFLVNLFKDGQFYIADSNEFDVGWFAHELVPLLGWKGDHGE